MLMILKKIYFCNIVLCLLVPYVNIYKVNYIVYLLINYLNNGLSNTISIARNITDIMIVIMNPITVNSSTSRSSSAVN